MAYGRDSLPGPCERILLALGPASEYFSLLVWSRPCRLGNMARDAHGSSAARGALLNPRPGRVACLNAWPAGPLGSNCMACWAGGCRRLHGLLGLHPHESLQAGNSRPGGAEYKNLRGGGRCPPRLRPSLRRREFSSKALPKGTGRRCFAVGVFGII